MRKIDYDTIKINANHFQYFEGFLPEAIRRELPNQQEYFRFNEQKGLLDEINEKRQQEKLQAIEYDKQGIPPEEGVLLSLEEWIRENPAYDDLIIDE